MLPAEMLTASGSATSDLANISKYMTSCMQLACGKLKFSNLPIGIMDLMLQQASHIKLEKLD
jgi:hypothetical protein